MRIRLNYFEEPSVQVTTHWYALCVSSFFYSNWDLKEYLPFRKSFALASKARAVVAYDRIINNEYSVRGSDAK